MEKNNEQKGSELVDWIKSILWAVIIALLIRTFVVEVFEVEGPSMLPTLEDNQRLIVNKIVYRFSEPRPGDIIIFSYSPERDFIKRVIAVEGDEVEINQGKTYVNGELYQESYTNGPSGGQYGPVTVPLDSLFVMGDNRNNSMDSRDPSVGFVSLEQVKGKAFLVFWPLEDFRLLSPEGGGFAGHQLVPRPDGQG